MMTSPFVSSSAPAGLPSSCDFPIVEFAVVSESPLIGDSVSTSIISSVSWEGTLGGRDSVRPLFSPSASALPFPLALVLGGTLGVLLHLHWRPAPRGSGGLGGGSGSSAGCGCCRTPFSSFSAACRDFTRWTADTVIGRFDPAQSTYVTSERQIFFFLS